jgi:hypothetical protein
VLFGDNQSGRLIQIVVVTLEQTLIIDIPMRNLSSLESQCLGQEMEIASNSDGNSVSYQKKPPAIQIDYASQYTEWIFTKIFLLPDSFNVKAKVFS